MSEGTGFFSAIGKFFSRIFTRLGLAIEKSSENDATNEAIVEREMRNQKARADAAVVANGTLNATMIRVKGQVKGQQDKAQQLQAQLNYYIKTDDEANGASCAEELANLQSDLTENQAQLAQLEATYKQNTEIIAESIRQIQKQQREFEALKTKVAVSRNMESLAGMMKTSIAELQGTIGGEAASAMERMRVAASQGQGQMNATMDVAQQLGSSIKAQQEARRARGAALFAEAKAKAQQGVQATVTETAEPEAQKQKIATPA